MLFLGRSLGFDSGMFASWVYAAPFLGGLFRFFLPMILERWPARKKLCIQFYVLQVAALWLLLGSTLLIPGTPGFCLGLKAVLLLSFWALASLCENLAYLIFISWNGALFPRRTLGRFYARREVRKLGGEICALIFSGLGLHFWASQYPDGHFPPALEFSLYVLLAFLGSCFILGNTLFFRKIPEVLFEGTRITAASTGAVSRTRRFLQEFQRLAQPFRNRAFRPLLLYGACFSFFLQLEQVSQFAFTASLANGVVLPFFFMFSLRLVTRGGQCLAAPLVGRWVDRFGTLRVMMVSQFLTAFGILFYVFAEPQTSWFLYVSAFIWVSYVGLNSALPKVQLEFANSPDDTPWLAAYAIVGSAMGCAGNFIGGWLYETYGARPHFFETLFLCATFWRAALALPIFVAQWRLNASRTPTH